MALRKITLLGMLLGLPLLAQKYTPPRTVDGQPDLQGIWGTATMTLLERPAEFGTKEFFTPAEAVAYAKARVEFNNRDRRSADGAVDVGGAVNDAWFDRGTQVVKTRRTSMVIDPKDGQIPYSAQGLERLAAAAEYTRLHPADGPEDLALTDRCLLWGMAGPPMLPGPYNNNYQIFQVPGHVVILIEMIHDVRMIPLDGTFAGRPHLPSAVRQWMGDSRGHWDGDTLVVDTTNFSSKSHFRGSTENMHLVERFTRSDADTITYEFTVTDPATFTRPWTATLPMNKAKGPLYEYACHEGNYAAAGILSGARTQENQHK